MHGALLEVRMARDSDILGGPEPDEEGTDLLGGSGPAAADSFGGPEPDEKATDLLGGPS